MNHLTLDHTKEERGEPRVLNGISHLHSEADAMVIHYFSDPISIECYDEEHKLSRFLENSGLTIPVRYHIGELSPFLFESAVDTGLLPVIMSQRWMRASEQYDYPISGKVWISDPPSSMFPLIIHVKAAESQSAEKAIDFYKRLRERMMFSGRNPNRNHELVEAAKRSHLDIKLIRKQCSRAAVRWYQDDLMLIEKLGIVGFPAFVFGREAHPRSYDHSIYYTAEQLIHEIQKRERVED
ncbi:hypothetical protein GCM10011318_01310 [Phaeocystidibacter marisrubri]|uniref:DsbA family protein n=1 Tax=Phaeocystidibacter marisrubri TaxID=1577780 RepID=A0A6L3ZDA2_9FLAO|nr:hypothetical protein F8C82_07945 [Phaeocystidibacter marisrubri]GGH64871.1 hypothetical protein GCM10011318_01310 [Phaeocystidibacter marisrubri]